MAFVCKIKFKLNCNFACDLLNGIVCEENFGFAKLNYIVAKHCVRFEQSRIDLTDWLRQ